MNNSPAHFDALLSDVDSSDTMSELESIIAQAEGVKARAYAKMLMLAAGHAERRNAEHGGDQDDDRLLDVQEAAKMLGMSERFMYRHAEEYGGAKYGSALKFSKKRLAATIKRRSYG